MMVRVFNYNTLEKVEMFEAHSDYIRSIIVHPTQPYILTSSGKSFRCEEFCNSFYNTNDFITVFIEAIKKKFVKEEVAPGWA